MGIWDWSKTAGDNGSIDPDINFAEGQAPSTINNSARALMAAEAEYRDDTGGALVTGGSSNAYTLTTNSGLSALADGVRIHIVANHSNTGEATINVDSLGAQSIRKVDATGDVALGSGDMVANGHYILEWDESANSAAGAFILLNPVPIAPPDIGGTLAGASAKTTPVDADTIPLSDSAASNALKKVTWANVKATLKAYFDTIYQPVNTKLSSLAGLSGTNGKYLRFGAGGGLEEADVPSPTLTSLGVSAFAQTLLDDANAAAARATLGVQQAFGNAVATTSVQVDAGANYQNTSGYPQLFNEGTLRPMAVAPSSTSFALQRSHNGSSWHTIWEAVGTSSSNQTESTPAFILPAGHYLRTLRTTGSASITPRFTARVTY